MTLLIPLGLLGLLSIAGLILIYIIKPNYQQKYISSTYVWALSLKLKKKRLPVSKLRNLLLILCQILFLVMCALALAQPAIITRAAVQEREIIAVIDSSASMRAATEGETRYERAIKQVAALSDEVFSVNGYVSVIVAGDTASVLAQRVRSDMRGSLTDDLQQLIDENSCSYGEADMNAALSVCESIININPGAEVFVYTDTEYMSVPSGVNVINVGQEGEWNAGILNAYTVLEDNYYSIFIEMACYGVNREIGLNVQVSDANRYEGGDNGTTINFNTTVSCEFDEPVTVVFRNGNMDSGDYQENAQNVIFIAIEDQKQFFSYSEVFISLDVQDSLEEDNSFAIYDGQVPVLNVLYASTDPNNFFNAVLQALASYYAKDSIWDIQVTVSHDSEPVTEGYDLYIYEHKMPQQMPVDGIVILWDPDTIPQGLDISLGGYKEYQNGGIYLTQSSEDPLLEHVNADRISVSLLREIVSYDPSFNMLFSCDGSPALLAKNDGASKVLVAPFSIHYSNLAIKPVDFVPLFLNLFENWIPTTVKGNMFSVYEEVSVNSRGSSLTVTSSALENNSIEFTEFPAKLVLDIPGTYTLEQTTYYGKNITERIYVKSPASESNIWSTEDILRDPYITETAAEQYSELILYMAAAMVALLFIEWILQARENL